MGRTKLRKFDEIRTMANVIERGKPAYETIKGNWGKFFGNDHPIVLELGCGYGEYTVGLARKFPLNNYIGIDIKGERVWAGAKAAETENLKNAAFVRMSILNLEDCFAENEVDEIWITFPDPRPKDRDEKRRLTHPRFLKMYSSILKENGIIHLKTDNDGLFDFTLETLSANKIHVINKTHQLYHSELIENHHDIKTRFEKEYTAKGFDIKYLTFSLS